MRLAGFVSTLSCTAQPWVAAPCSPSVCWFVDALKGAADQTGARIPDPAGRQPHQGDRAAANTAHGIPGTCTFSPLCWAVRRRVLAKWLVSFRVRGCSHLRRHRKETSCGVVWATCEEKSKRGSRSNREKLKISGNRESCSSQEHACCPRHK